MPENRRCRRALIWCALLATTSLPALASEWTYRFDIEWKKGQLAGTRSSGSFAFDASLARPDQWWYGRGHLSALSFELRGLAYDLGNAGAGALHFDPDGALDTVVFGSNCVSFTCTVTHGEPDQWFFNWHRDTDSSAVAGDAPDGISSASLLRLVRVSPPPPIPEPAIWWLLTGGLLGLWRFRPAP